MRAHKSLSRFMKTSLGARLHDALAAFGLTIRDETTADFAASASLYRQTREAELSVTDWPEVQKAAFCRQQFDAQHAHYEAHYPRARFLLLLSGAMPIGRVYHEQTTSELRLMEITIDAQYRGRGIGGAISNALLTHAMESGVAMGLHVESFNPAKRLYERQGFRDVETRGIYVYMRVEPRC
jgi:ribosomal protein S18 acetylase RimI-like enzyme